MFKRRYHHSQLVIERFVGDSKILIIDEAQKVPNIGLNLKLIVDHMRVIVIASGSASFDLAKQVGEPLTGRRKQSTFFRFQPEKLLAPRTKCFI